MTEHNVRIFQWFLSSEVLNSELSKRTLTPMSYEEYINLLKSIATDTLENRPNLLLSVHSGAELFLQNLQSAGEDQTIINP